MFTTRCRTAQLCGTTITHTDNSIWLGIIIETHMGANMTKTMTVVKFKVKSGFDSDFVDAMKNYDYSKTNLWRLITLDNGHYVSISEYDTIEDTGDDEVSGLDWLDSVTHKLEYFGESRTDALSGIIIADYDKPAN